MARSSVVAALRRRVLAEPEHPPISITWRGALWYTAGRPRTPIAIVLHTAVGTLAGMRSHFNNPNLAPESRVSAHFGVGLDGAIDQYVSEHDTAWANGVLEAGNRWPYAGNPNGHTLSIETEDLGHPDTEPVSPEQYAATAALIRNLQSRWPIELLAGHRVISPLSRSCPSARWVTGLIQQLANDCGLSLLI